MGTEEASKQLAGRPTCVMGRLSEEKRASTTGSSPRSKGNCRDRIKKASPSRVALMKLKLARLREGFSLGEIADKAGIDRGNLSKLENSVENVELNTLARLADALGYDVVLDLRKRS